VVLKNNDDSSFVDENVSENNNGRKKEEAHQKEIIAMELTLPQFYEFARDLEIARKSLLEEKM